MKNKEIYEQTALVAALNPDDGFALSDFIAAQGLYLMSLEEQNVL